MLEFLLGREKRGLHTGSTQGSSVGAGPRVLPLVLALSFVACSSGDAGPGVEETEDKGRASDDSDDSDDSDGSDGSKPVAMMDAGSKPVVKMDAGSKPVVPVDAGSADSASAGDAASANVDPATLPPLPKCGGGAVTPCGTFITSKGAELALGPYGVVMEPNVGAAFKNMVNALDDNSLCGLFASSFGQDQSETDQLLDLMDLDLSLYTVYRPARWVEGETYPIVTWGNGTCAQPEGYGALLRYVASQGFFVVAPNSRYASTDNTQRHGLDFAFKSNEDPASPYYHKLDTTKVAAMGHSQGGSATVTVASDARVKTVILFNGGSNPPKPYLTISGDRDIGNRTANDLKTEVNRATKAAFLFYHMVPGSGSSDGHLTLMIQPERVIMPTVAWLKYLLSNDAASKDYFVGPTCTLCGHDAEYEFGQKGL